jgi:hypothetical protein
LSETLPLPDAVLPAAPPLADELNDAPVRAAGIKSATVAVAASGPAFLT